MSLEPRAVLVHRRSEWEELVDLYGTAGQVEFALRERREWIAELRRRHQALAEARETVVRALPRRWRRAEVERADLSRFVTGPQDVILVVGPDGLVANTAKYLAGQVVLGVDPDPGRNPGTLLPFTPRSAAAALTRWEQRTPPVRALTMVAARTEDGQEITALNEVFLGHPSHQSARYRITPSGPPGGKGNASGSVPPAWEDQCSSGVIVATGTGAGGWCASIARERVEVPTLPGPGERSLAWFVREAWPSPATGTRLTCGLLPEGGSLHLTVTGENLVVFGDGIETDRLTVPWGGGIDVGLAPSTLNLALPT